MSDSHIDFATLEASGCPHELFLFSLEGHEALGWPFELEVVFGLPGQTEDYLTEDDFVAMLAGDVKISLGQEAYLCGVFRSLELLASVENAQAVYRGMVVPRLWVASQTYRSRVFQELAVPDIVKQVLQDSGLVDGESFSFDLTGSPAVREFVLQYEETDLAFASRLLEDEGIFLRFDHDGEANLEKAVFADAVSSAPDGGTWQLDPRAGRSDFESVLALSRRRRSLPAKLDVREHNYRTPQLDLLVAGTAVDTDGRGYQHLWAQHYKDQSAGKALAQVRAEELLATRTLYRGKSTIRGLRAGQKISIETEAFGLEGEYFVTEVRHHLDQSPDGGPEATGGVGYTNDFVAIHADVQYRPPRITPWPRIHGLVPAKVDGESPGTKAPIDDQGRYKVTLPFDVVAATGGRATRWIRMAQPFSGQGYGIHFPLHIGAEVVVAFVDGNPDRPIIVGAVPNPATASPVVDANATQSVVRTRAAIHIELEDDAT